MNTEMHGKQIEAVYWPDTETEQGRMLKSGENILLEMSATYHGDRDEFWIVQFDKIEGEFVEVQRHNLKFVEAFKWA